MRSFLIFLFCYFHFVAQAQVLAPDYPEQIFIPARPNVIYGKNAYLQNYFLPQLVKGTEMQKLDETIASQNKNFAVKPIDFSDCVYFNNTLQHCTDSLGNFILFNHYYSGSQTHYPPSLRFGTDNNKNNVDSLWSVNLFPKAALENYTQPFYFRKFEVTNAEYREFVNYVLDSVAKRMLAEGGYEDDYQVDKLPWQSQFEDDTLDWYFANISPLTNEKVH